MKVIPISIDITWSHISDSGSYFIIIKNYFNFSYFKKLDK